MGPLGCRSAIVTAGALLMLRRWIYSCLIGICLIACWGQIVQAGWRPDVAPGTPPDMGGDYLGAGYASFQNANQHQTPNYFIFDNYDQNGQVVHFKICDTVTNNCQGASIFCNAGEIKTINGCISSLQGYPGQICSAPKNPKKAAGDPIDPIPGNLFERVVDFTTTSGPTLSATRYYNSDTSYTNAQLGYSRFGYGWRSEYDRKLILTKSGSNILGIDVIAADGNPLHFAPSGSNWVLSYWDFSAGAWSSAPRTDCFYTLTTDGTSWFLTDSNATKDTFSISGATGTLQSTSYRGGYTQTFTYDGSGNNTVVSDSVGRIISFSYSGSGLVTSLQDTDGNTVTYTYLDRSGFSAPLSSQPLLVLQTVTYPVSASVSKTLTYLYSDTNPCNRFVLNGIVDENNAHYATWHYEYENTSPSQCVLGRAVSSEQGADGSGINKTTIAYDDVHNTRTVTNALGKQFIYNANAATFQGVLQLSSIAGQASTHTAAATTSYAYTYDSSNIYVSQASVTDGNGNVNVYTYDADGRETSRTEGSGSSVARTIATTWYTPPSGQPAWRVPSQIVEPNLTTNFTYDAPTGQLTQLTLADTTSTTGGSCASPYSTNGQTRSWGFTYYTTTGLVGLLHTVDGPLSGTGDTTTYTWQIAPPGSTAPPAGMAYLSSITNALGQTTNITSTNGRGQPLISVDPNGVTTSYAYDLRGRISSITVNSTASPKSVTSFAYDSAGNITQIAVSDGTTQIYAFTYVYDQAHRLTGVTNNLGESITYTLDALGNRTARVVKSSSATITKTQTATFDELGRVMANIGAASQTTTHAYDLNNNETMTTDPRSNAYGHAFDALDRLYQQIDPAPGTYTTTTAFNAQDAATSVTDARSLVTYYVRDGFGDVIRQCSPDTGTTDFWYDANGAVTKRVVDPAGLNIVTNFGNDATGRVTSKTFPASSSENVTYSYDATTGGNKGVGHLTSVADQSGSTAFVYDALGHVASDTRVIGSNSYATAYTYDAAGNVLTITYPSGRIVSYARDALGWISGITTKQNSGAAAVTVASGVGYNPFGPLAGLTFGNGVAAAYTYDQDYQLTSLNSAVSGGATIQNLTNGYDPAGNITGITDAVVSGRSQTLTYDNLNRVASATASGSYGSQSYTYDGVGNRLTRVVGGGSINCSSPTSTGDCYASASTSNQLNNIKSYSSGSLTNTRTFSYQASGQVSQDVRDASHTYTFAANDNGRNASAALNGTTAGAYLYNAFEQRVQKTVGSTVTQFVSDRFGHLLAEANGSGSAQKEYIWLDDVPVAVVDDSGASPVLYFIHSDQLGTPQKITSASAVVVWDGTFDPFGNAQFVSGAGIWNTSTWGNFIWGADLSLTNLRFPGQFADAETALNQNWFRDYDPTIGRYIQSDPIGLRGGNNTYGYVGSRTLIFIDPSALSSSGIVIWSPVGWGGSSLGHASAYVDTTAFSFNPGGMLVEASDDYLKRNGFRSGYGFELKLSKSEEEQFAACLSQPQGNYSSLTNNCVNPIQRCLRKIGRDLNLSRTPLGLMLELLNQKNLAQPSEYFPQSTPSTDYFPSAPWTK